MSLDLSLPGLPGWSLGPLTVQWRPCEILPESPMDSPKLVIYFNGGTLQNLLEALENSQGEDRDPQQKYLPRVIYEVGI